MRERERGVMEREVGRSEREKHLNEGELSVHFLNVVYQVRQFPTQSDVRKYQSSLENVLV